MTKQNKTRKPLEVKDDDSTIFHSDKELNVSIPPSLHLEDMCREVTRERGQENKGRAILFLAPLALAISLSSLRLDNRHGYYLSSPR